ncbi:MAG: leucyl/phenylalanyl-tRNA--protein transferase [Paludisphaera borealis]|uniref:leucyl/phenylalanyl-tRNA--protein transferase n=1 Tax=Paludisphaera borealis TaxID=1387353 RepID=UPI002842310C|nr:leucyl/phenylalanyl-tRNA--protein transferase [Paludisphaera borealis]MDR3620637.1 leucyl/phenylalanyl-tRNA--protein transferase [Paludisphaera borealis]
MALFRLGPDPIFPPPHLAEPEGLLAIGGDLSADRLLAAYRHGVFPWYETGGPILWWSPDPRLVLFPSELRVSRRLRRTLRSDRFEIRYDTSFAQVIRACAETPREHEDGTWITTEMQAAYIRLHKLGHAHCMEAWRDGALVGGVYGVLVGRCFCGESMFHTETDASKVALVALVERLEADGVGFIDCQVKSEHLLRLGAREIPRDEFLMHLAGGLQDAPQAVTHTSGNGRRTGSIFSYTSSRLLSRKRNG